MMSLSWKHKGMSWMPAVLLLTLLNGYGGMVRAQESSAEPDVLDLTKQMIDVEERGDKRRALELGHRVIALAEEALGGEHPTIALYLDHVGVLAHDLGEDQEAEQLLLRALSIQEQALGLDHVASQRTLRHLTAFYRLDGRAQALEDIRQRVMRYRADHAPSPTPSP
ncbi:MAG: tetratricopeptide repeat protein [Nitrospiraceae bacterium]|nr:tetratricopeptide repeat protein [Nitrospiraceae bacterium]